MAKMILPSVALLGRVLLVSLGLVFACSTVTVGAAANSTRVDGVRVYGRVSDVTSADIRAAIKDCRGYGNVNAIEVVSKTTMRAYFPERNLGWVPVRLVQFTESDGRTHPKWNAAYYDMTLLPEAFRLIRDADAVYIFPVRYKTFESVRTYNSGIDPHWSAAHFRAVEGEARRGLQRMLGHEENWSHSMNDSVTVGGVEPNNIGFVFRHGKNELILFFTQTGLGGTLNGERTAGMLEFKEEERMKNWENRYAQPELHGN